MLVFVLLSIPTVCRTLDSYFVLACACAFVASWNQLGFRALCSGCTFLYCIFVLCPTFSFEVNSKSNEFRSSGTKQAYKNIQYHRPPLESPTIKLRPRHFFLEKNSKGMSSFGRLAGFDFGLYKQKGTTRLGWHTFFKRNTTHVVFEAWFSQAT